MTLNEFIKLDKKINAVKWFDPETMNFFQTKIEYWNPETGYFITSEAYKVERAFTLRKANFKTADIDTIGDFQEYGSLIQALEALEAI